MGQGGVYKEIQEKLNTLQTKKRQGACFGPDEKEDIEAARKVCREIGIPKFAQLILFKTELTPQKP